MKKIFSLSLFLAGVSFFACQRQLGWDRAAVGTLVKDASGNCLPVTAAGNFVAGKTIDISNTLTIRVSVNTIGEYVISTDIINGYSFKATGTFSSTGDQDVQLACTGKPLVAGTDHFTIHLGGSSCEAIVSVLADVVPVANYNLAGAPGTCMNDTVKGNYIQGILLDSADKVLIKINVLGKGSYSIATDTVNGYSFSSAGIFSSTGTQSVTLIGKGVPRVPGNNLFKVIAGSGSCSFAVIVAPVVPVSNQDYFPLTEGSYWTYATGTAPDDTLRRVIKGDTTIKSLKFARMLETSTNKTEPYFFNLNVYDYSEFGAADKYTRSFQYGSVVYGMLPFLKEHLTPDQSWESEEFKGVASFGQLLFNKYYYKCLNNNAAITLNGQGFTNVCIITVYPQIRSESNPYGSTGEIYYYYYARGIGLIYMRKVLNGFEQVPMQIKTWHVN